jgi:Protein of unknown function (DUF642)
MIRWRSAVGVFLLLSLGTPALSQTVFFANPSFEEPALPVGYQYRPVGFSFEFKNNAGVLRNGSSWGAAPAPDGQQAAFLASGDAPAVISQNADRGQLDSVFVLSFDIAAVPGHPGNPVTVTANDVPIGVFTPSTSRFTSVTTAPFVIDQHPVKLAFTGIAGSPGRISVIDRIRFDTVPDVFDPSFESPVLKGGAISYQNTYPRLRFFDGGGIARIGSSWGFLSPPDGEQVGFLQSLGSTPSISFQVPLESFQSYAVTLFAATAPDTPATPVTVTIRNRDGSDRIPIGHFTPSSTAWTQYTSEPFVAPEAIYGRPYREIRLEASNPGQMTLTGVDLVRVMAVPLVTDYSFEDPSVASILGGAQYRPGPFFGIDFSGQSGIARNGSIWGFANAPDGEQVAFLQMTARITQRLTGLTPGSSYAVSFFLAPRPGFGGAEVTVALDGSVLGTFNPPATATSTAFTEVRTAAFTAGAPVVELTFTTSAASDFTSAIDRVLAIPFPAAAGNASFENPAIGATYRISPPAPALTFSGQAGIAGNGSTLGFSAAPDGTQIAFFQAGTAPAQITQRISGLEIGQSYAISFVAAKPAGNDGAQLTVTVQGRELAKATPSSTQFVPVYSASFKATASEATVTFLATSPGGIPATSGIDGVAVIPAPPPTSR